MFRFFKSLFIILIFVPLPTLAANTNFNSAPKPQANPFTSGYVDMLKSLQLPTQSFGKLSKIQDINTRRAIVNASKGQCPSTFSVKNTNVKVEHAKQCGKTEKEKKKKNGKKCVASGLQGGQVEAMCINGCCVGIEQQAGGSGSSDQSGQGDWQGYGQGAGNSGAMGGGQSQGMFGQLFSQLFQSMMGGGGSGSGSYNPNNYNYESALNGPSIISDNSTKSGSTKDIYSDDKTIVDNTKENAQDSSSSSIIVKKNEDYITTVISKNGQKVEIKLDTQNISRPVYGNTGQVIVRRHDKSADSEQTDDNSKQEIMQNELKAYKETQRGEQEPSTTGFKGEKIAKINQPSFWDRLSAWFAGLLGL